MRNGSGWRRRRLAAWRAISWRKQLPRRSGGISWRYGMTMAAACRRRPSTEKRREINVIYGNHQKSTRKRGNNAYSCSIKAVEISGSQPATEAGEAWRRRVKRNEAAAVASFISSAGVTWPIEILAPYTAS